MQHSRIANRCRPGLSRKAVVVARADGSGKLPWQAAMSEIKKRRDIKSIMSE